MLLACRDWGISWAQQVGAAGTSYFEPDGVCFLAASFARARDAQYVAHRSFTRMDRRHGRGPVGYDHAVLKRLASNAAIKHPPTQLTSEASRCRLRFRNRALHRRPPWHPTSRRTPETILTTPRRHAETNSAQPPCIAYEGDFQMLAIKFAVLALSVGTLLTMVSPDISSDLLLAIVTCLS